MAKIIALPDGSEAEFPDEMGDDQIAAVLRKQFPPKASATTAPAQAVAPAPAPATEIGPLVDRPEGVWEGLKHGFTTSAAKTIRGLGTTLLPKSLEGKAEEAGYLPSAQFIKDMESAGRGNISSQVGGVAGDILSEAIPAKRIMGGATLLKQALPRAAGLGAAIGGIRAEEGDVLREAGLGAVGGVLGEGVGRTLTGALSKAVRPSTEAQGLIQRGIVPTLGEAADPTTMRGKVLAAGENILTAMPVSGMTLRGAQAKSARQLMDDAVNLATPPGLAARRAAGTAPAMDTPEETIRQLRTAGSEEMSAALRNTTMAAGPAQRRAMYDRIDTLAGEYGVSPEVTNRLKSELNQKLWGGVQGGKTSANVIENVSNDLFNGSYQALRGNTNAQRVANTIAGEMRNWVNTAATQAGHDLPGIRQSLATTHALSRATKGGQKELTGERLMRGVIANDAAMRSTDTATRELRDLADMGRIIKGTQDTGGFRTPEQLRRAATGIAAEGAGGFFAPLANVAGMGYGMLNKSDFAKRLMLGDPAALAAARRALAPATTLTGIETATE